MVRRDVRTCKKAPPSNPPLPSFAISHSLNPDACFETCPPLPLPPFYLSPHR